MPLGPSLQSRLAAALPVGISLQAYHVSTTPSPTNALFAPLPGEQSEATLCESHFLGIASPQDGDHKEVLVYAVEILIFTNPSLTTLFVSKADSSGFSSRTNAPKGSPSIVGSIISTFVQFLLEPRLAKSRVVLSLFARSQNQYLFPGSIENPTKHVLDDRQLIKWWCRVLDDVLRLHTDSKSPACKATAHLLVPGCDKAETKAFFPPSSRSDSPSDPRWINSYPVELLVADTTKPPRHLVPRLPDDPKSRFLEDLDGDFVDEHGQWRSLKTLDQFWEMMSYRQECSAGRLVGFLWLVFSPGQSTHASLDVLEKSDKVGLSNETAIQSKSDTPGSSHSSERDLSLHGSLSAPNSGGIENDRLPRDSLSTTGSRTESAAVADVVDSGDSKSSTISVPLTEQLAKFINIDHATQPEGEIVINADQYQSLTDYLLQTDFAGDHLAAESTRGWVQKVLELSGAAAFGCPILGERTLAPSSGVQQMDAPQVNVLTGIRKKRKADNIVDSGPASSANGPVSGQPTVNTLSAGLVRKKVKS
ncbi:hypothetical protein A1O1_02073 [Capronia coronata CBS 617.96]|uniref:histone acetyltransferase n=1 Tax=Capronia coronata CBS 617.96 TaxID=1182541 RepID=W9YWM5_9EURO|nr:uncharacterized protein A1O1_02073 [Capronia coronata CBS 617.96]EXJ93681.1 hypothetical protein A1O1_02073 [Capronia coronata CBS 617.96]